MNEPCEINGAEILIKLLEEAGIEKVAGIPGGANLPIYDALYKSKIKHILSRHEQGAGFIAQGMSRSTGIPAVCLATSGPGATNLLTAIADAKMDSVPIIAITGQVPKAMIGTEAFQEVDICAISKVITKQNFFIQEARELFHVIPKAFRTAISGKPGPVLIDIPKDVQLQKIPIKEFRFSGNSYSGNECQAVENYDRKIQKIAEAINSAKRPLIYAGGGIINAGASNILERLARKNSTPVTLTLMGLGAFPPEDPLYLGMLGMHGAPYTNYILDEIDLLLAFGVRFDDRAVGLAEEFCPNAKIIHIDIDPKEIDKIRNSDLSLKMDINKALHLIFESIRDDDRPDWNYRISQLKRAFPFPWPDDENLFHPLNIIKTIGRISGPESIITTDVGQHQMWTAQGYPFRKPRTLLTSGGLGTMGFGLPVAIGASLVNPDKKVICISGDGSIQMNIQELATLREQNLNVTLIIFNNQHLGLVRQQQELFYKKNYMASRFNIRLDFASIGREYGIPGVNPGQTDDLAGIIRAMIEIKGPSIIDIPIHFAENVFPIVPPGSPNREMIAGATH